MFVRPTCTAALKLLLWLVCLLAAAESIDFIQVEEEASFALTLPEVEQTPLLPEMVAVGSGGLRGAPDPPSTIKSNQGVVERRFNDISFRGSNFTLFPPDPHGAAGTNSLISVVNSVIISRSKTGQRLFSKDFVRFFADGLGFSNFHPFVFDPKIKYDAAQDRFIMVALQKNPTNTESKIFLAVSKNGYPQTASRKDWLFGALNSLVENNWADRPALDVCNDAIYIANNMFDTNGRFQYTLLWIIAKEPFYDDATISLPGTRGQLVKFLIPSYHPAAIRGSSGAYLVSFIGFYDGDDAIINLVTITDPIGTAKFEFALVNIGPLEDAADRVSELPNAPQPGTAKDIETNDRRVQDALWSNGFLWTVFNVNLNGKATAYWVKIDTDVLTLADKGPIDLKKRDPSASTYYPSIAINKKGIAAFGFCASSENLFAGAYVTISDEEKGRLRNAQVVRPGKNSYEVLDTSNRNRWGDYTGIAVDPVDDEIFWVYNQYAAKEENNWATAWARVNATTWAL